MHIHRLYPICVLGFLLGMACSLAEEIQVIVSREVPRLSAEEFQEREQAQSTLLRLGLKAGPLVREALKSAQDPETRARLEAVLQSYALEGEDAYALKQIQIGEAFPAVDAGKIELGGESVAAALAKISEKSGIPIGYFPEDKDLQKRAEQTPLRYEGSIGVKEPAHWAAVQVLNDLDASFVIDKGKVVVVRLTPAVLFAKLERQIPARSRSALDKDLAAFDEPPLNHWLTVGLFIQEKSREGGLNRNKWFHLLANRACDEYEQEKYRMLALCGLRYFLGMSETVQQDVDDVFIRISSDTKAPMAVRREAMQGLIVSLSQRAQDAVLQFLDKGNLVERLALLEAIEYRRWMGYSAYARIRADPDREKKLDRSLKSLSESDLEELAVRALAILAWQGDRDAFGKLYARPVPKDLEAKKVYLVALSQRTRPGDQKNLDLRREKFDLFAKHAAEDIRALYIRLVGNSAGGKERKIDVDAALKLLGDPSPKVRYFAIKALENIYSSSAAETYREGLAEARTGLEAMLKNEPDARVKAAIEDGLKEMHPL